MKNEKPTFSETEKTIEFTFTEDEKGKYPITKDKGVIHFLSFKCEQSKLVKAGETWECEIISKNGNFNVIDPIIRTRSAEYTDSEMKARMILLKDKLQTKQ